MADRAALVTGGSSGIGLAIARALGEDGYGLTVSARRPEKLEAATEDLRSAGLDVLSVPANMAQEEALTSLVEAHKDRFGRLRSEEHTSELQSHSDLVCRLLLEKK